MGDMRPGPRMVTVAAALLTGAALAGCGPAGPPPASVTPPPEAHPPAVVAPPPATERPPLSPPVEVPLAPVPTVVGPYVPPDPSPPASPTPSAAPTPGPTAPAEPSPTADPRPTPLVELLPAAASLPPLTWVDGAGEHTAAWTELVPGAVVDAATAIAHVDAARAAGGACGSAADAVDAAAVAAAAVSLAADPAPGVPFELVLMRYAEPHAAADALAAMRALGTACEGVETAEGVLGALDGTHGATLVLRAGESALLAEAVVLDALLVTVLHEGAPPEAVTALLGSVR